MGLVNAAVLSAYTAVPNPQAQLYEDPTREAWRHLGRAAYIEFGLDDTKRRLEKKYLSPLEKKYIKPLEDQVPRVIVKNGALVATAILIISERRFSYTWTF